MRPCSAATCKLAGPPVASPASLAHWRERLPTLAAALGWRGRLLVVTLGASGSVALTDTGEVVDQPAWPIQQRDATGAGDAFGAGLIWSLTRGLPVAEALRVGNACGALIAAHNGILAHLPDAAAVTAFMATAGPG